MNSIDQLFAIAEIALTLAGFAGIIATFQFKNSQTISRGRVLSLSLVVHISLIGALFALLPVALMNFGMPEKSVWATCSALMALNITTFIIYIWRNTDTKHLGLFVRAFYSAAFLGAILMITLNLMNCAAIVLDRDYSIYFVNFLFCLFLVGFYFSRLLLYPLWKHLNEQLT